MIKEEKEAIEDIDLFIHCLNYGEMKMTIASERQKEIAQELQMLLNLLNKEQKEIEDFENIKKEHQIMKRIILENGLWETLLKDDEFIKHLNEEN